MQTCSQQFDDCFQIELPYKKIQQVIFLTSSQLLILYVPRRYSILSIVNRNETKNQKDGKYPYHAQQIKRFNDRSVAFILDHQICIFDLYLQAQTHSYFLSRSDIYSEQFLFQINHFEEPSKILFYKISVLKSTPVAIYYDIHLLSVSKSLQRIKKIKAEHNDMRRYGYACGQIFSYQITGYTIEVHFTQSGITHKINCIFSLFIIELKISKEQIQFDFTHQQLQNQLSSYTVSKKGVKKLDRKIRNLNSHTVWDESFMRSLVYKNCFNRRKKDHQIGIFRIKASKQAKYLQIMDEKMPKLDRNLKQMILNVLG